jgi:hypothetical protein
MVGFVLKEWSFGCNFFHARLSRATIRLLIRRARNTGVQAKPGGRAFDRER